MTPAAALELQHRAPLLIERVNLFFGRPAVTRLILVQGPLPLSAAPSRPVSATARLRRGGSARRAAHRYRRSRAAQRLGSARPGGDRCCGVEPRTSGVAPEFESRYSSTYCSKDAYDAENMGGRFGDIRRIDAFAGPRPSGGFRSRRLATPQSLLAINKDDRILGNPAAPITIVEYASLTCPHCAHFTDEVLPEHQEEVDRHRQGKIGAARLSARRRGGAGVDDRALRAARPVLRVHRHLLRGPGEMGGGAGLSGRADPAGRAGWDEQGRSRQAASRTPRSKTKSSTAASSPRSSSASMRPRHFSSTAPSSPARRRSRSSTSCCRGLSPKS